MFAVFSLLIIFCSSVPLQRVSALGPVRPASRVSVPRSNALARNAEAKAVPSAVVLSRKDSRSVSSALDLEASIGQKSPDFLKAYEIYKKEKFFASLPQAHKALVLNALADGMQVYGSQKQTLLEQAAKHWENAKYFEQSLLDMTRLLDPEHSQFFHGALQGRNDLPLTQGLHQKISVALSSLDDAEKKIKG